MNGIKDKYSLHVVVATIIASGMILITNNGVADAVKATGDTSTKQLHQQLLAPPGPFGQNRVEEAHASIVKQQQAIKAPKMPEFKQTVPALGVAAPAVAAPDALKPVFQRAVPNAPQALQPRSNPVLEEQPVAPVTPAYDMLTPMVTMPAPEKMPQFNQNMLMQYPMPQFRGHPGQLRAAPQIQQFKYIPLPVYQANFGHPQAPSFNANVPGRWVPQMQNK